MLKIAEAWAMTCRGRKYGPNQDRVLLGEHILSSGQVFAESAPPLCAAVADGISGDPGGEIAAQTALMAVRGTEPRTTSDMLEVMEQANEKIHEQAQRRPGRENMCTTFSGVWIYRNKLAWCARGDTPIYLLGPEAGCVQVNEPHSDRVGRLTSYLGADAEVTMRSTSCAVASRKLSAIHAVLIMSDGVSRFIPDDVLQKLAVGTPYTVPQVGIRFLRAAWRKGSADNMSFVMVRLDHGKG